MTSGVRSKVDLAGELAARRQDLIQRFQIVRSFSNQIAQRLEPEDCVLQSMPDVSPTRWHLAHTTWFFETFVLGQLPGFRPYHEHFDHLFNSYYNTVGEQFPRARRGLLSRPTVAQVLDYRWAIDKQVCERLRADPSLSAEQLNVIELGLHHEQQHQELMLSDIKHVFSQNPLNPVFEQAEIRAPLQKPAPGWVPFDGGTVDIGHSEEGFAFDNESPQHRVWLEPFSLQNRVVTVGEFLAFIEDDGYQRPELWLSLGWQHVQSENWRAPLYWRHADDRWMEFTLAGLIELEPSLPVCHVSYFEADAYARWAGARLPTEFEWEVAAKSVDVTGNFAGENLSRSSRAVHPRGGGDDQSSPANLFGDVWEWTASAYSPYPRYQPPAGALGEYNGKFMCNQYVLRGGSCATPVGHIRRTYRNFFPPEARWQFSGIRLAETR